MKKINHALVVILTLLLISTNLSGQSAQKKGEEIKIKTSAQCGMCKDRIEKVMAYEKGIYESDLDLGDKVLTVRYNPRKTTLEKIRKVLNETGYDADDTKADPEAYAKLPDCCKKPADRHEHGEKCNHEADKN